jgi:hypothetical protein
MFLLQIQIPNKREAKNVRGDNQGKKSLTK